MMRKAGFDGDPIRSIWPFIATCHETEVHMKPQDLLTFSSLSLGESERMPVGYYTHYLANHGRIHVALHPHGEIMGYIMANIPKEKREYNQIELKDAYVHPVHRREGIFRLFINDLWTFAGYGTKDRWHSITCVNRFSRIRNICNIFGKLNFVYDRRLPYFYPAVDDRTTWSASGLLKEALFKKREAEDGFESCLVVANSYSQAVENEAAYENQRFLGDCVYHDDVFKKKPLWERDHITTYY